MCMDSEQESYVRDRKKAEAFMGLEAPIADLCHAAKIADMITDNIIDTGVKDGEEWIVRLSAEEIGVMLFASGQIMRMLKQFQQDYYRILKTHYPPEAPRPSTGCRAARSRLQA